MIIFYKEHIATKTVISLSTTCDNVCSASCIKPKSKCCNKYKKKGVNCKRCPNILLNKAS